MKLQKETTTHGKWYDDACGTAFALELIGERWSLLIIRELLLGGKRFSDLRGGLPGISAKALTERLDGLERAGVLRRRQLAPPVSGQIYELTPWGYLAEEPIMALGRWAVLSPDHNPMLPLSAASLIVSFRTMFDAVRAGKLAIAGGMRIGREEFSVAVAAGRLTAVRGAPSSADFLIEAPAAEPIAAAVYGKIAPEELAAAGLRIAGDRTAALAFFDCFCLPGKLVRPS